MVELIARGRDCDVFDLGNGSVLRRHRQGRDQSTEARIMAYAGEHGFAVPAVVEVRAGGRDLVLEKIDGPTMVDDLLRRPWRVAAHGRLLAGLHRDLHRIPAPDWLPALPGGDRLLHFDLHPLNVILASPRATPVVIDWTNAVAGRPGHDVARAWALMATAGTAEVRRGVARLTGPSLRRRLVDSFVTAAGRDEAVSCLAYAVELTLLDSNITDEEKAAMVRLVDQATRPVRPR